MEIVYILSTVILGVMLWDIHRSVTHIAHIAQEIHQQTAELLRRSTP